MDADREMRFGKCDPATSIVEVAVPSPAACGDYERLIGAINARAESNQPRIE
jgi:hypothetical protein